MTEIEMLSALLLAVPKTSSKAERLTIVWLFSYAYNFIKHSRQLPKLPDQIHAQAQNA